MGKKDFKRPPFGTQTARFDVTGVHPKSKIPGSFTQMPYDKFSMTEQRIVKNSSPYLREDDKIKLENMDNCLQNIRQKIQFSKKQFIAIEELKKKRALKVANVSKKTTHMKKTISFSENVKQDEQLKPFKTESYQPFDSQTKLVQSTSSKMEGLIEDNDHENGNRVDDTSNDNVVDSEETSTVTEIVPVLSSGNISGNAAKAVTEEQKRIPSNGEMRMSDTSKQTEEQKTIPSNEEIELSVICKRISFEVENLKVIDRENRGKRCKESLRDILNSVNERLHGSSIVTLDHEHEGSAVYKIPKIMKNIDANPENCLTPANSDDSLYRYGFSQRKEPIFVEKSVPCETILKRKLGPGSYNTMMGGFSTTTVDQKASGPGWARQIEVERLAALPHLLYKEQWEENKMLRRKLGPGSYQIKDFVQINDLKPKSMRGICENLAPRFEKATLSFTPGPGTYGIGGIPQKAIEEKCQLSMSTKGMLDSGDRKRNLPSVGSHLGPGTYRHKTCTEEMINKVTSLKGPYDLYSGDRNKPISEGYQAAPKLADLGPGQYEIGSFIDELNSGHKGSHGVFGKMVQYPEVPTERLFLFSQAHCPNKKDVPGPGAYSLREVSKPKAINSPGFLSSAKRDDKISQKFFTRNFNPVGAGRYDIQKYQDAQDINGHSSAFKSKTGKPNLQMAKFLQERIRRKDIPVEERMFTCEPERPALSRSVTVI